MSTEGEKDLQNLTSTMVGKIGEGVQKAESLFSSACIYRVPEDLRQLKKSAYTPRLIAIGPLHRKDKHLQTSLQHVKMSYTNSLLHRLTVGISEDVELAEQKKFRVLRKCLAEMRTSIDDAKKYYAEEVKLDEEMLLVDGCFILEFLYRDSCTVERPQTDPIFGNTLTLYKVKRDLVLLENQIPFFVLEILFHLTVEKIPDRRNNWSLTNYVRSCYDGCMRPARDSDNRISSGAKTWYCSPSDCVLGIFGCSTAGHEESARQEPAHHQRSTTSTCYHILHNLHDGYLPHLDTISQINLSCREMPSASELVHAGVKFVADAGNDLFRFKFREPQGLFWWCCRAHFEIPPLQIEDTTESLLRNLIALEQCCPNVSKYVSSYAFVMDMLVNTEKDIQVLEKAGVLTNMLGATEDATLLFNNLCKEIVIGKYFLDTCSDATKYSKRCWPRNMAHVRRTYLASPWTFIAFCAGFIVFVIAVVQFIWNFVKNG